MPFEINRGLGKYNSTRDLHAALGITLGATPGDIRKRYLKIAKSLHPDSRDDGDDKKLASDLLSKLINPAYQVLSQEKEREEYEIILRLLGQQLVAGQIPLDTDSEIVQAILKAPNPQAVYLEALEALVKNQYENLSTSLAITEQISELNLAYLWRQQGGNAPPAYAQSKSAGASPAFYGTTAPTASTPSPGSVDPAKSTVPPGTSGSADTYTEQYVRRAQEFMKKGSYQPAIKELRDALKLNPSSSRCHALMGEIYLQQGQATMAKVSFRRALELNPQEAKAVAGMEVVAKLEKKNLQKAQQTPPPKAGGGGLFGLFGKKNK